MTITSKIEIKNVRVHKFALELSEKSTKHVVSIFLSSAKSIKEDSTVFPISASVQKCHAAVDCLISSWHKKIDQRHKCKVQSVL